VIRRIREMENLLREIRVRVNRRDRRVRNRRREG
jgi:hypothetical protein